MDLATLTSREIQDLITFYSFERKKLEYQIAKIDGNLEELQAKLGFDLPTIEETDKNTEPTEIVLEIEKHETTAVEQVVEPQQKEKLPIAKEEKAIKPAKRKRGRPRKNKKTEIESKSAISKKVTEKKEATAKKGVSAKPEKKQRKTASQEKKRIPLAPRLKYSKELKEREQRLAAEAVKESQAKKDNNKKEKELFFSDMDKLILETVRVKGRLVHRAEFDKIVDNWAKAQHLEATEAQLYRKISKSLHRLTSAKYNLLRKYNAEGKRIFAYGDANWFFKKTGKIKKQYADKLPK